MKKSCFRSMLSPRHVTFLEHDLSCSPITTPANQSEHILCFKGGASSKQELNRVFETDWEERCCTNVKYMKNNAFVKQLSMETYSSTPQKLKQDFVKGHNRNPLKTDL